MAKNFEDITKKFLNQAKSSAEGFGDMTGKTAKEIRETLERQGVKPVSLHLRNGERIDALMTPEQRKELDNLISRGRGGLVSVKEAVFIGDRKRLADATEDLRVSAGEVIAVGIRTLKDESDAFFASIGKGKTAKEKLVKMREAINQPIGKASRDKAKEAGRPFRPDSPGEKSPGPASEEQAPRTGASSNGNWPRTETAEPAAKKPARKPSPRKPRAKAGAAEKPAPARKPTAKAGPAKKGTTAVKRSPAKKDTTGKAAAKKPVVKKPAAKKPAVKKPAAKKPAVKKPASGRANQTRKPAN